MDQNIPMSSVNFSKNGNKTFTSWQLNNLSQIFVQKVFFSNLYRNFPLLFFIVDKRKIRINSNIILFLKSCHWILLLLTSAIIGLPTLYKWQHFQIYATFSFYFCKCTILSIWFCNRMMIFSTILVVIQYIFLSIRKVGTCGVFEILIYRSCSVAYT